MYVVTRCTMRSFKWGAKRGAKFEIPAKGGLRGCSVCFGSSAALCSGGASGISEPATQAKPAETKPAAEAPPPKEESSSTDHTIRLGGQTISYKATASTTLLKNDKGEAVASIFSIAYVRTDVKDSSTRPIAFVYNGGPGSSSIWLHMGVRPAAGSD